MSGLIYVEADELLTEFMKAQVRERKAVIGSTAPSERKAGLFIMLFADHGD
jgi:hypothetical protein